MIKTLSIRSFVDLSASKFAWSISTKKSVVKNGFITIPPHDTVIIFTNETVYVSEKICGTYHPKVTLVSKGLSHIATTLDPLFIGISCISVTNLTDEDKQIKVNSQFVTIMFYYLKTSSINAKGSSNPKEFITRLEGYEKWNIFEGEINEKNWLFDKTELKNTLISSEGFKKEKQKLRERRLKSQLGDKPYILEFIIIIIMLFLYGLSFTYFDNSDIRSGLLYVACTCLGLILADPNKR